MNRRVFISFSSIAALSIPARISFGQKPTIGFLGSGSAKAVAHLMPFFMAGLKQQGFSENLNVGFEYKWANGQYDSISEMALQLVREGVVIIVAIGDSLHGPLRPSLNAFLSFRKRQ